MSRWILTLPIVLVIITHAQDTPPTTTQPASSQPADNKRATLRKPPQANILKNLLNQEDRPRPIQPQGQTGPEGKSAIGPDGQPLLMEGTSLVERPGRLVREGGKSKFTFHLDGSSDKPRTMEILENQLLETMEREAEAGYDRFIVSAQVTRYRGQNFLLLRKVLRDQDDGNVGP